MELYDDSGYLGIENLNEIKGNEHLSNVEYKISKRPSAMKVKISNGG